MSSRAQQTKMEREGKMREDEAEGEGKRGSALSHCAVTSSK